MPEPKQTDWRARLGGYNDWPPNAEEVSQDEFWDAFFSGDWTYAGARQPRRRRAERGVHGVVYVDHGRVDARLWWRGTGDGLMVTRRFTPEDRHTATRFYRFAACVHDWEVAHEANCYREYACRRCGARHAVDSSG